jgi:uncharacterized protein
MEKIQIRHLEEDEKKHLQLPEQCCAQGPWSVWECEPSSFDWHYDETELAYVYEGRVKVKTPEQDVEIKAGDFVTFPAGLDCLWEVKEQVRKVYKFSS